MHSSHYIVVTFALCARLAFCNRISENVSTILMCAKEGKLFSSQDGGCHFPLSQGHCDEGEMLVLGRKGSGICVPRLCEEDQVFKEGECVNVYQGEDCQREGEVLQYNLNGEVECGCADGWGKVDIRDTACYQHSARGPCPSEQIVLPSGPECEQSEVCVDYNQCPAITKSYDTLVSIRHAQPEEYREGLERLKEKLCGEKEKKTVCCRLATSVTTSDVEKAIVEWHSQPFSCLDNPCGQSAVPWPGESGCFPLDTEHAGSQCTLVLREGEVACLKMLDLRGGLAGSAYRRKCPQGKIWSKWRRKCVNTN